DPQHEPSRGGVIADRAQDRREARDGPGAEVVAVGEAPRQDDAIDAADVGILVPEALDLVPEGALDHRARIAIVVRPGKGDDAPPHGSATSSKRKSSMMPFASSFSHI